MAEVLGIVAGAAQLLDLSTRVLVASSSLYGKLKNIPDEIEALKKNTQLFIDLLWMISSDFDGPINSQVHSLHVTHRVTSILHGAIKESEELALLLESLSVNTSSSARRKWSAVVSATKEKEVAERCRRIESFKSTLQLWYQHQSNARLRRVEQQLSQVTISQNTARTSMGLLAQQPSAILNLNRAVTARLDSYQNSVSSSSGPIWPRRRRPRPANTCCTCGPSRTTTYFSIYGFQLFCSHASHSPDCPRWDGSTSWSCGVRALGPKIQMMVGIQLGGWTLSMVGGLSPHNVVDELVSPAFIAMKKARFHLLFLSPVRWVTKYTGFVLPPSGGITTKSLEQEKVDLIKSVFSVLIRKLREAFESGTASPSDQTGDNRTLLFEFIELAIRCLDLHETLYPLLDDIVKLLVAGNADPNAAVYNIYTREAVTPLLFTIMATADHSHPAILRNRLGEILISHGCELFHGLGPRASPVLSAYFIKHPSLLEDYGQQPAHIAVLQRSETELSRLVAEKKVDLGAKEPPILRLAVGWPAGLQILLDAGANPGDAILAAVYEQHLPSIELLIDNGCPMFDLDCYDIYFRKSIKRHLLSFATLTGGSSDVAFLLVQKLVERRLELLQLALRELPEACLKSLEYQSQGHVRPSPDFNALEIVRQLESHNVEMPISLWPGSFTTIYHLPGMTSTLAEKLYDVGFRSIDEPDGKGQTPLFNILLYSGDTEVIRLAQWYLRKGSRLPRSLAYVDFLDRAREFTVSISACIWITKGSRLCGPLGVFQQLHPEGVEQRDSCSCWCSTSGCSPVGIVLRPNFVPWDRFIFTRRQRWLFNLARYSSLGLALDKDIFVDICRLEVFDRLGMAHTCSHYQCDSDDNVDDSYSGYGGGDDKSSERGELQEEDHHLKKALDSYLELYLCLLHTHASRFESFWIAWWIALEYFLPFEINNRYYRRHRPLELDGVCDPQSYDEAQSHESYEPNVEAITAFLAECVPQLSSETRAKLLGQLEPTEDELFCYPESLDCDSLTDELDGDEDDRD